MSAAHITPPVAPRRADSASYAPTHPQFRGQGQTRSCDTCNQHRAFGPGWKKGRIGMTCPTCVASK